MEGGRGEGGERTVERSLTGRVEGWEGVEGRVAAWDTTVCVLI